jgi:hypothetical protein
MFTTFSSLWFNVVCFSVHLIFGIWLLVDGIGEYNVGKNTTKMSVYYSVPVSTGWPVIIYKVEQFGTVNIVAMLASFELITAFVHLFYVWGLNGGGDRVPMSIKYRYFEYAVTAPLMIVIISILFGLRDVFTLIALAFLCSSTMLFGVLQSWDNTSSSTAAHWMGWVPFIVMWAIIMKFFEIMSKTNDVPDFVVLVIILEFILFGCFGLVQLKYDILPRLAGVSAGRGVSQRSEDGLNNLLSLISKLLLAGIIYGNFVSIELM